MRYVLSIGLLAALVSCGDVVIQESATGGAAAESIGAIEAPIKPVRGASVLSSDGVPIVYDVDGQGELALVFVHGWSCTRGFWRDQVAEFAADHTVVTLDLGGHGDSGSGREGWSVLGLGDDVEAVVRDLDLARVVLVGHSMGAPVALEAARRMPERVEAVIAVDALHNAEFEPSDGELAQFDQLVAMLRSDFPQAVHLMFSGMLPADADPGLSEWIIAEAASRSRPEVATELMEDFLPLDLPALMSSVKVPVRAINAAPVAGRFYGTEVEINRRYSDFDAMLVEGVGHFLQLERPDEFNTALRQTLAQLSVDEPPAS